EDLAGGGGAPRRHRVPRAQPDRRGKRLPLVARVRCRCEGLARKHPGEVVMALFDTSILLDYLLGDKRADAVFRQHQYRAVSVISWVEVMCVSPEEKHEATRAFLRSFERLSINESIADEALVLVRSRPGLAIHRALTWATAIVN